MKISLIAALSPSRVIGRGLELPWRLSTDLKRFQKLTMGHHLILGRKTFKSIGKALPGRKMLVLSRSHSEDLQLPDTVQAVASMEEAIVLAHERGESELLVAGGGEIYNLALPYADRMYLTHVDAEVDGDVFFPEFDPALWTVLEHQIVPAGPKDEFETQYAIYERIVPELPPIQQ